MLKTIRIAKISILSCLLALLLPGCFKDKGSRIYTIEKPVYKLKTDVLNSINGNGNEVIKNAGKIYIKDQFIFLNDIDRGIHIIDNSDPSHPHQVAFLNIPGNLDIAVKENTLYADMYADLLSIDITDPRHAHTTGLLQNLFSERLYINGYSPDSDHVIADWIKKDTIVAENYTSAINNNPGCAACMSANASAPTFTAPRSKSGTAGSMAKMVLINNYIYAISERHSLSVIDVSNNAAPIKSSTMFAGYDLETIYPFADKLFLGSSVGMFMFNISDPVHPVSLGSFTHGRACDPVVTDGNFAYVTLHSGSQCGGTSNELDIIDIKNIEQAFLVKSYPMTSPTGLSKDGDLLFICDGSEIKLYNAADANDIKAVGSIETKEPYDVIAGNKIALVVAKDGLYQYDYSDVHHMHQLSFIATK